MKLKVFLWLVYNNKLQTSVELRKRNWKGNPLCGICGKLETADHIFFTCITARFTWACLKEALGWTRNPVCLQEFLDNWVPLGCKQYSLKIFLMTIVLWGLCTSRNKRVMKGKFTRTPSDIIFKINALLQRWQKLLRKDDRGALEVMVSQIRGWVEEFQEKLKDCPPDDVFL